MVKLFLVLSVGFVFLNANAQVSQGTSQGPATVADRANPTPSGSPTGSRPLSLSFGGSAALRADGLSNVLTAALSRFNSLGLEGLVAAQRQSGVQQRTYMASFTASGAFAYDYELSGKKLRDYGDTGISPGLTLIPFTVALAQGGVYYLAVDALSFRNMNSLQNGKNFVQSPNDPSRPAGFFRVVDTIDFLVFKIDQNYSLSNVVSRSIDYASFDAKLDILGSRVNSRYLAIKVGGALTGDEAVVTTPDGQVHYLGMDFGGASNNFNKQQEFFFAGNPHLGFNYGLEFNNESIHGLKINVQAMVNSKWIQDDGMIDNANSAQYVQAYNAYSQQVAAGVPNPTAPVDNRVVSYTHNSFYFRPSVEVSQKAKGAKYSRLGVGISGNIPISDVIQTNSAFGRLDLAPYNNQLVNVKLFVHF